MAAIDFPNSPTVGQTFTSAGITWQWTGAVWNIISASGGAFNAVPLTATFDGMGAVVLVNSIAYVRVRAGAVIVGWSIIAEGTSPTCTIDILEVNSGTVLPTVSICGGNLPQLTTGNAVLSTNVTSWSTTLDAFDIVAFKVTACLNATKINVQLLIG